MKKFLLVVFLFVGLVGCAGGGGDEFTPLTAVPVSLRVDSRAFPGFIVNFQQEMLFSFSLQTIDLTGELVSNDVFISAPIIVPTGVRLFYAFNGFSSAGTPLFADSLGILPNNLLATPINFRVELPGGVRSFRLILSDFSFLEPVVSGTIGDAAFEFMIDQFGNVFIF